MVTTKNTRANISKAKKNNELADTPDLTELVRVSAGDIEFIKRMIQTFKDQAQNSLEYISSNLEEKNYRKIRNESHRILTSAQHLNLKGIASTIKDIEDACIKEAPLYKIGELTKKLELQIESTWINIDKEISNVISNQSNSDQSNKKF